MDTNCAEKTMQTAEFEKKFDFDKMSIIMGENCIDCETSCDADGSEGCGCD